MSEFCRVSFKINKENTKCTEQVKCKYTTLCNKAFSNERVIDYISYTMYKITTDVSVCVHACTHKVVFALSLSTSALSCTSYCPS